jgi:hypothetical protein
MSGNEVFSRPGMRITVVQTLDTPNIDRFYPWYMDAFEPLLTKAAGRHMLTRDEFAAEMTNERIEKYVAWTDDRAVGLTTLTADVTAVPWIEPAFYFDRYPNEAARGALFYLGFTLVDPNAEAYGVFKEMMDAFCRRVTAVRGVCGFDFCDYNARGPVGRIVPALAASFGAPVQEVDSLQYSILDFSVPAGPVAPRLVDTQRYYIADFRRATDPLGHTA